jgi:hypothetical protein
MDILMGSSSELSPSRSPATVPTVEEIQTKPSSGISAPSPLTSTAQNTKSPAITGAGETKPNPASANTGNQPSITSSQSTATGKDSQSANAQSDASGTSTSTPTSAPDQNRLQNPAIAAAQFANVPAGSSQPAVVDAAAPAMSATANQQAPPATANQPQGSLPDNSASNSPSVPLEPKELPATPGAGSVQIAQIVSKAAQSEMRIGLTTPAFGSVELRTTVRANDVGVLIGSEKGDLRSLLSNELPGIANTLQQQNLKLNQVNFQPGFAFSRNLFSGGDSQPRYSPPLQPVFSATQSEEAGDDLPALPESGSSSSAGLSILA